MSANMLMFLVVLHIKAAVFTTLMLGLVYAARHTSSRNRYLVMRMVLGTVAALPLLMLLLPSFPIPIDLWQRQSTESTTIILRNNAIGGGSAAMTELPYSIEAILVAGYLSVSALLLLRVAVGFLRTRTDVSRYRRIDQPHVVSLFDQIRRQLGMKNIVGLVMDSTGAGPYVWGLNKQVIAVPKNFLTVAPDIQRTVLTHELIHVIRRDTTICLASRIVCCLYWINPAVWLLNARLKLEMERSCDDWAVASGINATDYAGHLLQAIRQFDVTHRPSSAVAMARASSIRHRIGSLLNSHRQRGIMSTSRSVGIFSTLLLAGTALAALSATNAATTPLSQEALIAGVKRLVPENCETSQVRFLTTDSVEITGHCLTVARVATFMRNLDRAVGKPDLVDVKIEESRSTFRFRLTSPQTFKPD